MSAKFRVVIIGGGLGGLCLAQGLRTSGIEAEVYERDGSAVFRDQGYRISLKESGAHALRACLPPNLYDLCVATSIRQATRMVFMDEHLHPAFTRPIPSLPPDQGFGVNRLTLREILLYGLADAVRFGTAFERYEQLADGRVRAWFTDGSSATADLLVGADGTGSAVRAQLLPDAVVDELHWSVYGRTPITGELLAGTPDVLLDTFNRVTGPEGAAFAVATCRTGEPAPEAAARLAPGLRLTAIPDYFQWITPLASPQDLTPAALHALAAGMVRDWHPAVARIIAAADVPATFSVRVTSARPVAQWSTPNVTLLGDAVHTMSPGRGDGANVTLRDAETLTAALTQAATGNASLLEAKQHYEQAMLAYAFAAVAASRDKPFAKPAAAPVPATWESFISTHSPGDIVPATVTAHLPVGAFIEISPEVKGILLASAPPPGTRIHIRIKDIDHQNHRLTASAVGGGLEGVEGGVVAGGGHQGGMGA